MPGNAPDGGAFDEDDVTGNDEADRQNSPDSAKQEADNAKKELEDALEAKRNRDMRKGIGPSNRSREYTRVSGTIDPDRTSIAVQRDGDRIVVRCSLDTIRSDVLIEKERAEQIRDDLDHALRMIEQDAQ